MSKNFIQNAAMRQVALSAYRLYAQSQFWRTGPRIFVNSLPKAGTHLLMAMLDTIPGIMNSRQHIRIRSVIKPTPQGPELDQAALERLLATIRKGQLTTAHLPFVAPADTVIRDQGFGIVNLVRSPRDVLISHYFYIFGLRRHRLHQHLTTNYPDKKAMILAIIEGPRPGEDTCDGQFRPFADLFRAHAGWLTAPGVLTLRYEDLVGTRGGGDDESQLTALSNLSRHLSLPIGGERLQSEWKAVQARSTPTLRKGTIGDWVNHFDPDIEAAFVKQVEPFVTQEEPVRA